MRILTVLALLFSLTASAASLYTAQEKSIDGKEGILKSLEGKVVLIVNIASQCGYTPQLEDLEKLYQKYKARNFVVLGVPTNDFGGQTPEDDKGMKEFCSKTYNVTFPLLNKRTVKGTEKRPLYKILTEESPQKMRGDIGWNFEKFLITKKGEIVERWGSSTKPLDEAITKKIESLL